MSPTDGSETNPYAPPDSEIAKSEDGPRQTIKRPASVRWARVILLLSFGGFCLINGQLIASRGWDFFVMAYQQYPLSMITPVVRTVALLALLFGGRSIAAYWLGCVALGATLCEMPFNLQPQIQLAMEERDSILMVINLIILSAFVGLFVWLFIRFTFGRPSRLYFRVAKS